jgi:hypothetical protein
LKIIEAISVFPIDLKKAELKSANDPLLNPIFGKGYSLVSALTNNSTNAVLKN